MRRKSHCGRSEPPAARKGKTALATRVSSGCSMSQVHRTVSYCRGLNETAATTASWPPRLTLHEDSRPTPFGSSPATFMCSFSPRKLGSDQQSLHHSRMNDTGGPDSTRPSRLLPPHAPPRLLALVVARRGA